MPPSSPDTAFATEDDHVHCAALLRDGSRTFQAASLALPAETRRAATALYAFCRIADDAIDSGLHGRDALCQMRSRLDAIYSGTPSDFAADRAFADVVHRHGIPRALPEGLLEGFEWDLAGRRYRALGELNAYAARVAGTVGAMMTLVMGGRAAAVVARACELGVAMQLTNIARDVGEDARMGRLYLPLDWLAEEGIDGEAWLQAPRHTDALGAVTDRLLRYADHLYERSASGIAELPVSCRPAMHAARLLYREIGHEVRRRGLDSVGGRAVVPWTRKSQMLAAAAWAAARPVRDMPAEMLEETRFLVDAVVAATPAAGQGETPAGIEGRVVWLIDLFLRLEDRDRSTQPA
jgi:phytoene synthase